MSGKDEKSLILKKNAGEIALGRTKNMLSAVDSILANAPAKRKAEGIVTPPQKKHEVDVAGDVGSYGKEFRDPTTGMEFVLVKGGCYQMGDTFGEEYKNEKPVHEVCVDDFYMGKYEVTQREWRKIMDSVGSNPSYFKSSMFKNRNRYPVETVSWNDITENFLSKLNRSSGKIYRLPTEAEWEYAAREGGKKVRFGNGKDIADPREINFSGRAHEKEFYSQTGVWRRQTTKVGSFAPNSLGLYDMSGNVEEWCSDWFNENYYDSSPRNNPEGPDSGSYRVYRGGSWGDTPRNVRAANRNYNSPDFSSNDLGFRLVLPVH
ncbi:formylglycine-generating enzyme family protein [Desulforhopalus vacuolatus]|uniref:formylglycine-generating enzyme family protein n=1 Tax=Desulforhopalus vacuolatus TaxID=40414 RepID=UPI00196501B6|nr:formylglycine-generating enzyme family protein [Desulforhopalus vacuolatus]MBM9519980.1 formylglycine-generating enzyme family protein [Desulforhopalus vacuolatus]